MLHNLPFVYISDLSWSGRIFEFSSFRKKNKTRWTFFIFFFENSSSIGTLWKNEKKNLIFDAVSEVIDIYGRAFLKQISEV